MSDQLHENPERDGFRTESPIRAFTTWITEGNYALGKGFRPSLQHMIPYMDALDRVENWKLLQVLESATLTPSFLFHREPEMSFAELDRWLKNKGFVRAADPDGCVRLYEPLDYQRQKIEPITRAHTAMSRVAEALDRDDSQRDYGDENPEPHPQADDPVNPKHYGGTACAEIGERMTANSYQVLKYNWRLGEKDDPLIELGKAIWYLDREIKLYYACKANTPGDAIPDLDWLDNLLEGQGDHTRNVAEWLHSWNRYGNINALDRLRGAMLAKKAEHEVCTTGLAV